MFGYVTAHEPELKVKEFHKYKGYYCGLCQQLKRNYGHLGQLTLTYDCLLYTSTRRDKRKESRNSDDHRPYKIQKQKR